MRGLRRVLRLLRVALIHGVLGALMPAPGRRRSGPVRLRRALEELGGTWVKLGQTLALRFDLLPAPYCHELFGLLNRVAPFPYSEVERIVRSELGRDLEEVFTCFAHEPFGAASIGQVHDAALRSGERVAVKIQRPGVERLIATDISLMHRVSRLLDMTHVLGGTQSRDVIDEFERWTRDELDYTVEGRNACALRDDAPAGETGYYPAVHLDHTTRRVLTTERLEGVLLVDVIRDLRSDRDGCAKRLRDAGYDLDRAAANIVWNFLHQVYAVGVFHADLHPANLLLLPGDRIGYVDFGIIGRLPQSVRESLVRYAGSLFTGDADEAVGEFLRWVQPSPATNAVAARDEMIGLTQRFLFDFDHAGSGRRELMARYQVALLAVARAHRMRIDPRVVLYAKTVLTIDSVTSELSPGLDLQSLHLRFFGQLIIEGISVSGADSTGSLSPADEVTKGERDG